MSELKAALHALQDASSRGVRIASEPAGKALLEAVGIDVPRSHIVNVDAEPHPLVVDDLLPVMAKVILEDAPHKSELGAVTGPFHTREDALQGVRRLRQYFDSPILLEHFIDGGVECYVGLSISNSYGPIIGFGLGGLWVEVLRDVQHRRAPINLHEARDMLADLRAAPLLRGSRGRPAVDEDPLCEAVSKISLLAQQPKIVDLVDEVEINPLLAGSEGAPVALDCVLTLKSSSTNGY